MSGGTTVKPRRVLRGAAALLLLLPLLLPGPAFGRDAPEVSDPKTAARLNKAIEYIAAAKFDEARNTLKALQKKKLSPYEVGRIESILAAAEQGLGRYDKARDHLRRAIDSGGLAEQEQSAARFQLAQLFMASEKWKEGAETLQQWFKSGAVPNAFAYYLLAVAYCQLKEIDKAIGPAQKALDLAEKPQEGWVQLVASLRLERKEYALALPLLQRLINLAPEKKMYWTQLSGVYGVLEQYDKALAVAELANLMGFVTEEHEYRRLVDLLVQEKIPYRAATVFSKAIVAKKVKGEVGDWERLADAWAAARELEKATVPMARAARMAESGETSLRLAELWIQLEDWGKALEALQQANEKGKLQNPGDAHFLSGVVLYNLKKLREARASFERAVATSKRPAQAEGWLNFVTAELNQ
jgi:tetratricopeptide (TPR) repeat protein